ncbi:hypothetical protein GCM10017706_00010 [Lactococcus lactis subsp. hordniae]
MTTWASSLDTMPTRILTSTKVRNAILQNAGIKGYFKDAGLLPTAGTLNQVLQQFGLPTIATYDAKYYKENAQGVLLKSVIPRKQTGYVWSRKPRGINLLCNSRRISFACWWFKRLHNW